VSFHRESIKDTYLIHLRPVEKVQNLFWERVVLAQQQLLGAMRLKVLVLLHLSRCGLQGPVHVLF
jgi:hypothetical protein